MGFDLGYYDEKEQKLINKLNNQNDFKDITIDWVNFLKILKKIDDPSFLMWPMSTRGWGKTAFVFSTLNTIMENDKDRFVQFLKSPEMLIKNIEKYCPDDLKGRFSSINKLREVEDYAILIIDEGLINANASNALFNEMKRLEGFLSSSRHYDVIFMINSTNFKILRTIRGLIDIKIYKHLSPTFFIEYKNEDPILQDYEHIITKLKKPEAIVFSGFEHFEKIGRINFDYEIYCPWYNSTISKNMKDANPDAFYEAYQKTEKEFKKLAKDIIKQVGYGFRGRNGLKFFKVWFKHKYAEISYDYQDNLKDIHDFYLYYLDRGYYERIKKKEKSLELINKIDTNFKFEFSPEKIFETIKKEKRWRNKDRDFEIYFERKKGVLLDDLAKQYPELNSPQAISKIELKVQGAFNYYKGKFFEKLFKTFLDTLDYEFVDLDGTPGHADIVIYDEKNNTLYILTLKCEDVPNNVKTYTPKDIEPELKLAYYCHTFEKYDYVFLILAAFNTNNSRLRLNEYNFNNPGPLTINF